MNNDLNFMNESENNYNDILNSIDDIQKMYKDIYRLSKSVKTEDDQKNFYDKIENLITSLNHLSQISHKLDNEGTNLDFIRELEENPINTQEKLNDQFIIICQMLRGKKENLEFLKSALK